MPSEAHLFVSAAGDEIVGEARKASQPGWVGFSVKHATGQVRRNYMKFGV